MSRIPEWLNQQYPHEPPLSTIKRNGHGIHHSITGMLLCPIRYDWDDEEYEFSLVLDKICSCSWTDRVCNKPREAQPNYNYTINICIRGFYRGFNGSSDNPEKGFLQSLLLVKTFKHIFTSPSSSHDISILGDDENNAENMPPSETRRPETGKTKANTHKAVTANLNMTRVTQRAIAYAAVQVWNIFDTIHIFTNF